MTIAPPRLDPLALRSRFPTLGRHDGGQPVVFLDGPGGTQVPLECIAGIERYLGERNANTHGRFATSRESDALIVDAHAAAADFLGAAADEVAFGPNMTTLTFALSRAIGRLLQPDDELVVTRLDHDANIAPWLIVAEERGVTVRWVDVRLDDCTLDLDSLGRAIGPRTRLVALGLASNAVGTINPVAEIAQLVHAVGGWLWVDAVHAAPHIPIDVVALDADFLVCSPYKFFGPHLGLVWGRRELLETLPALKVRPAPEALPYRLETGTQPHELLAGLVGTLSYLESIAPDGASRSERLRAAMTAIRDYERELGQLLIERLAAVPGVRIRGITERARIDERCPTVAFTVAGHRPAEVTAFLGGRGIAAWDGDYYAYELVRALGLAESGGMVRVGLVHYNTAEEVERLGAALEELS